MPATLVPTPTTTTAGLGQTDAEILSAALCLAAKLPEPERHYDASILDLAQRRYRGLGLQETILRAAQANGCPLTSVRADLGQVLQAGFSSLALDGMLSNVATKFLLAGFDRIEASWREIATIRPVKDFKPVESYRLGVNARYEKVGPGGELKHGRFQEEKFTNQADTYGKLLTISRTDIINDDLGALTEVPERLGRGAAMALNEQFWTVFLDNAGFFTAGNGCLLTGPATALSIDALTQAEIAFNDKSEADGTPLSISPRTLLVPKSLAVTAAQLMNSLEIRSNGSDAYPTTNPHAGKFQVVSSVWLNTPAIPGGSRTAWYLLADPRDLPVIEVAFLGGQEKPTIESAQVDFSVLGIQLRGFHDFGIKKQDPRGAIKMMGV
jgi:hypothetical protein